MMLVLGLNELGSWFIPYVGKFLETFKEYPPRQKADTFNLDAVMKSLMENAGGK